MTVRPYTARSGVLFTYIERRRITSQRGLTKHVDAWHGHCRKCGTPFEITVPAPAKKAPYTKRRDGREYPQFGLVHCKTHRLTRREAFAEARRRQDPEALRERLRVARERSIAVRQANALKRWGEKPPARSEEAKEAARQAYIAKRDRGLVAALQPDRAMATYRGISQRRRGPPLAIVDEIADLSRDLSAEGIAEQYGVSVETVRSIRYGRVHVAGKFGELALKLIQGGADSVETIAASGWDALKGLARLEALRAVMVRDDGAIETGERWSRVA